MGKNKAGSPPTVIKNFRKVHEWLYRGGQPNQAGLNYLQQIGIRTVISLRWNKKVIAKEMTAVERAGMRYESIPLNYWSLPSDNLIEHFLSILDDVDRHPVFVHCFHGSDRTGVLLAIYRMAREGWDMESAYQEMKQCGFHGVWVYHYKWAIYRFAHKLTKHLTAMHDDTKDC
ncbi:MAG: tyrosine-protein phosphatase [Candidatus Melainabacteria bacterium]|nr:tyrosine-protein phosphatase [Candidatus Melainabacteria bacterium]